MIVVALMWLAIPLFWIAAALDGINKSLKKKP